MTILESKYNIYMHKCVWILSFFDVFLNQIWSEKINLDFDIFMTSVFLNTEAFYIPLDDILPLFVDACLNYFKV